MPKIYCLTLKDSPRKDHMRKMLDDLDLDYEFVFGRRPDPKDVPWDKVMGSERLVWGEYKDPYACGIYGCCLGHLKLVEKAITDRQDCIISIEDDVTILPQFKDKVIGLLPRLHDLGGIVNMAGMNIYNMYWRSMYPSKKVDGEFLYSHAWANDSCYILDKDGMQFYRDGLKECNMESDVYMSKFCSSNGRLVPIMKDGLDFVRLNEDSGKSIILSGQV